MNKEQINKEKINKEQMDKTQMNKEQLAEAIKSISLLRGDFILRSGLKANEYFDKYLFESKPQLLAEICSYMQELIPSDTQVLAGLEMGGIPLAVALSLKTGLPCVFVRKKAKSYGTKKISEGCSIIDKKVCVVEDVITTGGQLLLSTKELRDMGAVIKHAICVIYRGKKDSLQKISSSGLHLKPLFTMQEILNLSS